MNFAIPMVVVYVGLFAAALALLVATGQNKWSPRVFFILALRLVIGWHFLFEGLHKINTHLVGPTETSRPFTSEPYFAVAEGPFGDAVRKAAIGDVDAALAERVTPDEGRVVGFSGLTPAQQAELCPPLVAKVLEQAAADGLAAAKEELPKARAAWDKAKAESKVPQLRDEAAKAKKAADDAEASSEKAEAEAEKAKAQAVLADAKDTAKREQAMTAEAAARAARRAAMEARTKQAHAEKLVADAQKKIDDAKAKVDAAQAKVEALENNGEGLKLTYARWLHGADRRDAAVKFVSTDVPQTVPERLAHIALMKKNLDSLLARQSAELGNGYTHEQKRTTEAKADLTAAKAGLLKDADDLASALVEYATGKPVTPPEKPIKQLDQVTMWAIAVIGACLMFGLFTPVACVAGAGFLLMTYLTHPPFPWYPLPPNTEGNPLFVNKNVIEMIGLLVVAVHPTGRWLGLDSIWLWLFFKK